MSSHLLLASALERAGIFVAAVTVVGWIVYAIVTSRLREPEAPVGSEVELAPNRKPYYDDEVLEGPRLERFLGWALLLLIVCAVGPLVYWLNEPSRQAGAVDKFDEQAVHRGESLFMPTDSPEHGAHFGCATCHGGMKAEGGSALYTITDALGATRQVTWAAPRLDNVLLRYSPEEVRTILEFGRANTPMPAWGVRGGGPMNDQQLDDLVAYLESIQVSAERAKEITAQEAEAEGGANDGAALFASQCARCHTKGWSYGEPEVMGGGAFGPNLTGGAAIRQFPNVDDMIEFISTGTEFGKPYGTRGVGGNEGGGMPGFGRQMTPEQIRAVVEYVRGL